MELSYGLSYSCLMVVLYVLCNLVAFGAGANSGAFFVTCVLYVHQSRRITHPRNPFHHPANRHELGKGTECCWCCCCVNSVGFRPWLQEGHWNQDRTRLQNPDRTRAFGYSFEPCLETPFPTTAFVPA